jgi:hypothetical protein
LSQRAQNKRVYCAATLAVAQILVKRIYEWGNGATLARLRGLPLRSANDPLGRATGKCLDGKIVKILLAFYESSLRAGPGWRESLYRHQGCFEASDCGRLGRQAAGHPWSVLRVVKSCRKTVQRPRCCSKPPAAALNPGRHQSLLSKLSTERETRPMGAGT